MTANGLGQTYLWDAENRLVKITYADNSKTEFIYDGLSRRIRITERNASNTITSDKRYLWSDGNQPAEEREANGTTVTKRYFPQGEQRIGGSDAGYYYYTKDHLGSIREITNASGALATRYDFDLWGKRTKLSGTPDSDVGFTGHHHHAKSGLVLTWYRAYDAEAGRWLSADPLGEMGGMNLYGYVGGDPIRYVDPLGLDAVPNTRRTNIFVVNPNNFGVETLEELARNMVGNFVQHPNSNLSGQCAVGAQYLSGTKIDGRIHDSPSTTTWREGRQVDGSTLPGTMAAYGWVDGRYPNQRTGNHTVIYMGNGWVLEQNVGPGNYQMRHLSEVELAPFHEVESSEKYDSGSSKCTKGTTRNP
jgi:RHS repeat-associated protein